MGFYQKDSLKNEAIEQELLPHKNNHNPEKHSVLTGPEQVQTATHTAQWEENNAVESACYQISTFLLLFLSCGTNSLSQAHPSVLS